MIKNSKTLFYGIDFGTSNSVVSCIDEKGKPYIIPLDKQSNNQYVMRSVIYVSRGGKFTFGNEAIKLYNRDVAKINPSKRKIVNTGRLIKVPSPPSAKSGFKPDQIVEEIIEIEEFQTGRLLQGIKSFLGKRLINKINLFGRDFLVEELVGLFLKDLKRRADEFTKTDVKKVVLGRPVNFVGGNNEIAADRLVKASKMAGFTDIKLQLEPIGAAYDFGTYLTERSNVLVFDFGGGTLDLSLLEFPQKNVISNTGIPLGGDIINSRIFLEKISQHLGRGETYGDKKLSMPDSLYQKLQNWYAISLMKSEDFFNTMENYSYKHSDIKKLNNLKSLVKYNLGFELYEEIDRLKKTLSLKNMDVFKLHLEKSEILDSVERTEFEELIKYDLLEIDSLIKSTLKGAGINEDEVDYIAITGGSSLIPAVRKLLSNIFGEEKLKGKNTFTSVASGLAYYGKKIFVKQEA